MADTLSFTFEFTPLAPGAPPPDVRIYVDVAGTVSIKDDVEVALAQAGAQFTGQLTLPAGANRQGMWFEAKYIAPPGSSWQSTVLSSQLGATPASALTGIVTSPAGRFWAQLS